MHFQTHRRVVVLIPSQWVRVSTNEGPRHVHHTRLSPRGVPLDVRLPRRVVAGPVLREDVLRRGSSTVHAPQLPFETTYNELSIFVRG
jgi:hypothetical protein